MKKLKIKNSNKLYKKAIEIIPGGSQTFSKGPSQFTNNFAPKYLKRGKGCNVWDEDNNKFIDYVMGCQPLILGYADKDINKAVQEQLQIGSTFSLMNKLEIEVAELLVKHIPSAEMVRFGKNGGDATTIAIKIARAVTGKQKIAFCGYHGWHDWFIATTDKSNGIPDFNKQLVYGFEYNNIRSLEKIFEKNKNEISCVIMEPITVPEPACFNKNCKDKLCKTNNICKKNNFLHKVKEICKKNNALLIFDEVVTGFRYAIGGAQEYYNVTPDLTALAKGISNGIPLSAIVGKKEYMSLLGDNVFFSFTYGGECLGLAAAKACIKKLIKEKVPNHLNIVGSYFKDRLNKIIKNHKLEHFLNCDGHPCRSIVTIKDIKNYKNLEIKTFVQQELFRRGILWAAYHSLSFMHKKNDINKTLNAFDETLEMLSKIIKLNLDIKSKIEGDLVSPVFRKVSDFNSFIDKKTV
jgi:glutamate-1-semialdehyde aminotransferase